MKHLGILGQTLIGFAGLLLATGCGGGNQASQKTDAETQAQAKVDAFKRLADDMVKDPKGVSVAGSLEEFRMIPFDAKASPKQAEEIMQIYRTRLQGKFSGENAQEIQQEVAQIEAGLKRKK